MVAHLRYVTGRMCYRATAQLSANYLRMSTMHSNGTFCAGSPVIGWSFISCQLFILGIVKTLVNIWAGTTNRWTGATESVFRIKRDPAKLLGSAVARSTPPLGVLFEW